MKAIFVTGTDTEVGKTIITGLLGHYFLEKRLRVITQKWLQTGGISAPNGEMFSQDIAMHLKLMKRNSKDIADYLKYVCLYIFKLPASPHLAASVENRRVNINKMKKYFRFLVEKFDLTIVEGLGGALVPVTQKKLVIDIANELKLPVIIVVRNKLGAINHTLLTVEAIKKRNMKILGIVFNNLDKNAECPLPAEKIILKDNPEIVKKITGEKILGVLPYCKSRKEMSNAFTPIGDKIFQYIKK